MELRRPNGHADGYAPTGANPRQAALPGGPGSWQRGHQYAVRFRSPRPRDAIGVPHRGHGAPGTPVDRPFGPSACHRTSHRRPAPRKRAGKGFLVDVSDPGPRREAAVPEQLGEPHVPDPGHEPLVEKHVAEQPGRVGGPHSRRDGGRLGRVREQVGPETEVGAVRQTEHRAVPEPRLEPGSTQHEPWPPLRRGPRGHDAPATGHPEVAVNDDAAVEAEEEVLAARLDVLEHPPVDGPGDRRAPRVRRRRLDPRSRECAEPAGSAADAVALWHLRSVGPTGGAA